MEALRKENGIRKSELPLVATQSMLLRGKVSVKVLLSSKIFKPSVGLRKVAYLLSSSRGKVHEKVSR